MNSSNQLSFLPDDYLDLKIQRRTNAICVTLFAVVVLLTGAAFHITEKSVKAVEAERANVNLRYAEAAAPIERFKRMQDQQRKMEAHAAISTSLLEKAPRAYLLAEITKALPPNVSLMDLDLDSRPRTVAPNPQAAKTIYEQKKLEIEAAKLIGAPKAFDVMFKITGMAGTDVQVAAFMNQLSRSKVFHDVNLVVSDEFQPSPQEAKQRKFVIEMTMIRDLEIKPQEPKKEIAPLTPSPRRMPSGSTIRTG